MVLGGGGLVTKSCLTPVIPWTLAHQAPLSMGFSRQEYWIRLPFPSSGDLLGPGIEYRSPALQANSLPLSYLGSHISSIYLQNKNAWGVKVMFLITHEDVQFSQHHFLKGPSFLHCIFLLPFS